MNQKFVHKYRIEACCSLYLRFGPSFLCWVLFVVANSVCRTVSSSAIGSGGARCAAGRTSRGPGTSTTRWPSGSLSATASRVSSRLPSLSAQSTPRASDPSTTVWYLRALYNLFVLFPILTAIAIRVLYFGV